MARYKVVPFGKSAGRSSGAGRRSGGGAQEILDAQDADLVGVVPLQMGGGSHLPHLNPSAGRHGPYRGRGQWSPVGQWRPT